jgi:dihydrofolate reductase
MKASIYIATSLDGFIARRDHTLDWLELVRLEGEDYGYFDFMESVDCILLGRNTYNAVRNFEKWPYGEKKVFVLTHRPFSPIKNEVQVSGGLKSILEELEANGLKHVYIDGGSVCRLGLTEGIITDITLSVIPILLGDGISLFGELNKEVNLQHLKTKDFKSGLVQISYKVRI